jgi:hypothetical protein
MSVTENLAASERVDVVVQTSDIAWKPACYNGSTRGFSGEIAQAFSHLSNSQKKTLDRKRIKCECGRPVLKSSRDDTSRQREATHQVSEYSITV